MLKTNICVTFAITFFAIIFTTSSALRCYTGYKIISGQSIGNEQMECKSSSEYCYNMTATAGIGLTPMRAGCSKYRCFFSKDTCRTATIQDIPVSICCCSTDLCNGK